MLGMGHHYYQGRTGNREMVDVRNFIVSNQNPVVHIFKNNGYQVHFVHDKDYLLTGGCLIDFCYPSTFWSEFINILLEHKLLSPQTLNLKLANQEEYTLNGLYVIDEKILHELSDEAFISLRKAGALVAIYAVLMSMQSIKLLANRKLSQ